MASSRKRKRATNNSTFVGALLIESLAVVVMIGLFFFIQGEREKTQLQQTLELVRPVLVESQVDDSCRFCSEDWVEQERPTYSVLEIGSGDTNNVIAENRVEWRMPGDFR